MIEVEIEQSSQKIKAIENYKNNLPTNTQFTAVIYPGK